MILQQLPTHLYFDTEGKILFHAEKEQVQAWSLEELRPLYSCTGQWLGRSQTNESFLTRHETKGVRAWEVRSSRAIPLAEIDPESYAPHERYAVYGFPWPYEFDNPAPLEVHDNLGLSPPERLLIERRMAAWPERWAMLPNRREVAVIMSGDSNGAEWAYGVVLDLRTGQVVQGRGFTAQRTWKPRLCFSVEHNLLIAGENTFRLYDLGSGRLVHDLLIKDSLSKVIAVHPHQASLVAVDVHFYNNSPRGRLGFGLVDTSVRSAMLEVEPFFPTSQAIRDVAFHPAGSLLACLYHSKLIQLWDFESRQLLAELTWE